MLTHVNYNVKNYKITEILFMQFLRFYFAIRERMVYIGFIVEYSYKYSTVNKDKIFLLIRLKIFLESHRSFLIDVTSRHILVVYGFQRFYHGYMGPTV